MLRKLLSPRYLVLILTLTTSGIYWHHSTHKQTIASQTYAFQHPVYGASIIDDPLAIELINSPTMQRLKNIDQYGVPHYAEKTKSFSRYQHCVGVYLLLKRFCLSREEQIAGLLHDASHTVFSHVAERVFGYTDGKQSYQDTIHRSFLEGQGIGNIVAKYNLTIDDIVHDDNEKKHGEDNMFAALEQDLPDMCADRIDYNIEGALSEHLLTKEEIQDILNSLRWNNEKWFFTDAAIAKKFADVPLYLTVHTWGCPFSAIAYTWAAQAIRRAFEIGLITHEEFHTSTDDIVGAKLNTSDDPVIKELMPKAMHARDYCVLSDESDFDIKFKQKFRGIDPLVQTEKGLERLTAIDPEFAKEYNRVKDIMAQGWFVKYKTS